ncbi:MAG: GTP-binding protein [Oscillatoriales cyanobacterium SM2_1_8]|nr:GTP-binding protein [Oscillatoriales cyanobacterium SM2_1_8]
MTAIAKKVCLLGDFGVGKTSLVRRYVEGRFDDRYLSTVGVKISRKEVHRDAHHVQLIVWDVEGNTKFRGIAPAYMQGAAAALIAADATRPDSIAFVLECLPQFLQINPKGTAAIAFNKVDLLPKEAVQRQMAQLLQDLHHPILTVLPTSAKTGLNVETAFAWLAGLAPPPQEF